MNDFEVVGTVAPEYDVIEPNKPTTSQILSGTWQQPGLGTIQAVGGMARAAGDLTGFRTLQDWGAEVARNAKATRQDLMPMGMDFVDQAFTGALGSVGQMLPWMFAGGPVPGIAAAGVQSAAETYSGYRDYGFSGGRAAFHAGINGLAEAAGEKISLPVLWNGAPKGFMKQAMEFLTKDMVGEQLTTFVQGVNSKFADQPGKTVQSFLDDALMTAAVVPMAAGMQLGVARGAQAVMPSRQELPMMELKPVPPEAFDPGAPPPPAVDPTVPPAPAPTPEVPTPEASPQEGPEVVDETPEVDPQAPTPETFSPEKNDALWMPDSREAPPDEQIKSGRIDLNLYAFQGVTVEPRPEGFYLGHYDDPIYSRGNWKTQFFPDYDSAAQYLADLRGFDLRTNPELLNTYWTDFVMKKLMDSKQVGLSELSGTTLQYIDGLGLKQVMKSVLNAKSLFGQKLVKPSYYSRYNLQEPVMNGQTLDVNGKMESVHDFVASTDAVRIAANSDNATAKRAAKRVEGWAKLFGLKTKFIIETTDNAQYAGIAWPDIVNGVVKLGIDRSVPYSEITLAHEFGHALVMDTLMKADPILQLKVFKNWATNLQKLEKRPGMAAVIGMNGVNRIKVGYDIRRYDENASNPFVSDQLLGEASQVVQYQTTLQEHLADQVAQYIFDNKELYTPAEQSLWREIADMLQNFYKTVVQKFMPNTTFYEYLDTLRGNAALNRDPDLNETPELPKEPMEGQPGWKVVETKAFAKWFGGSKVVDGKGNPLRVFHGTTKDFSKFSAKYLGEGAGLSDLGEGFYFSDDPAAANTYASKEGGNVRPSFLVIKNPATNDVMLSEDVQRVRDDDMGFESMQEYLTGKGYDGIIFTHSNGAKEYVVFDPSQIRSATNFSNKATPGMKLPKKEPAVVEENGIDPKHKAYAEKQRNKMLAALKKAVDEDTFDTIVEEIDPTGLVENFNFDRAQEILEMQGIPPEAFMSKTARMDETFLIRAQTLKLQTNFPDLARDFTKSRESVKRFGGFLRKMLTAVQIRKRYGEEVPPIEQGVNAIERMEAYKARARTRADDRIKQMKALGKDQRNKVFKLLIEEDKNGVWQSDAVPNTLDGSRKLSPEVARRHGITEEGALLYAAIRKDFWDVLKELESLAMAAMARNVNQADPISVARYKENVRNLQEQTASQLAQPYAPHTRFGDFYVQVSSETGKVEEFYQFESKGDAVKWAAKLRGEGKNASAGVLREDIKTFAGLPPSLIQSMKGSLDLTDEQMRAFEDILKNMSGGQSFVRKMKKRKDIPGWAEEEQIFPRVYADYMTKYANHAGRLKFSEELKQSEISLKQMIRDEGTSGRDTTNLGALLNWLQETNRYAMNPTSEWANVRGAVTLWYLGFSVKSAAVNSLSVPMVTFPYLAQRFGDAKAIATISRAYKDLAIKFNRPGVLTDDENKFMEDMRQQNILDESFSSELAGIREGGTLADTMDVTPQGAVSIAKYYGMWMFHKMEGVNRQATALAAYRLARTETTFDPMSLDAFDSKAADFAKKTVQDTQNVNAQWNRSEFMRGGKSVLTMFMSYQQNIIFQMFGGDASWMRLLAIQLLVAGMMGLPFAKDADNLIKWFARKVFDTDASAEKAVREWLSGFMKNPDWVLNGGSYNIFGSNLQGSLGMGQIIPGLDALAMEGSFPERLANAAPDVGGPAAAAMMNFMQAMASNDPDLVNRFNRTLPAFAKQASQGWTMFNEGVAKNSMGDPIADATKKDAMMKMLGFQSTDVSKESAKRFAQKDTARFWLTERQYVLQMYYMASKPGNAEFASKAREALTDYNQRVPNAALKIGADEVLEGIKSRSKADEKDARGAPRSNRDYLLYQEVSRRY